MTRLERLCHFISYALHPAVLMILTTILISALVRGGSIGGVLLDVAILVLGILPGLLYIYFKARKGEFSYYHLLLKEERRTVFPILLIGLVGAFVLYWLVGTPTFLLQGMAAALVGGIGVAIISRFWKISMHAAVAAGCFALLIPLSEPLARGVLILAWLAGLSRLPIKHHTPFQVGAGWVYGFGVTTLMLKLLLG